MKIKMMIKNNKRKRGQNQNQHIVEVRSSDSGALQVRRKMLAEKGTVRSPGSEYTKVLGLLGTKEILGVLMQLSTLKF